MEGFLKEATIKLVDIPQESGKVFQVGKIARAL